MAVFSTLILFLFPSCEKKPEPFTTNSSITGSVLMDEVFGDQPVATVIAEGPYGRLSATTDKDGIFWFKNVGNGTYTVECTFPGFGTVKHYGIQVFGSDTVQVYFEPLYKKPTVLKAPEITNVQVDGNNEVVINTSSTECGNNYIPLRFFVSTESRVNCDIFDYSTVATLNSQCSYIFPAEYLYYFYSQSISGQKVYITAYVCNERDMGYLDTYYNLLVFSSLITESQSNTVSFIMP